MYPKGLRLNASGLLHLYKRIGTLSNMALDAEINMLEISGEALIKLGEMIAADGGPESGVRIAPMGGGISGSGLGLIVDEPSESDVVAQESGVLVIVEKNLMEYCQKITVEFQTGQTGSCGGTSGSGFVIVSKQPIAF